MPSKLKAWSTIPGAKVAPLCNVPLLLPTISLGLPSPGHQLTMSGGGGMQVGLDPAAQYLPPVFEPTKPTSRPPHAIISMSLSAHTAVCCHRPAGALVVLVATQLSVPGVYLPPVSSGS